jgi:hypothetical protein
VHDPRDRGERRDPRNAQDAPGAIFSRGAATPVSPFFATRIGLEVITPLNISAMSKTMWTLPPPWTHRTRPQGFGNLATNARFPQRPHRSSFSLKNKKNEEQNHSDQPSTKTDHPQRWISPDRQAHVTVTSQPAPRRRATRTELPRDHTSNRTSNATLDKSRQRWHWKSKIRWRGSLRNHALPHEGQTRLRSARSLRPKCL